MAETTTRKKGTARKKSTSGTSPRQRPVRASRAQGKSAATNAETEAVEVVAREAKQAPAQTRPSRARKTKQPAAVAAAPVENAPVAEPSAAEPPQESDGNFVEQLMAAPDFRARVIRSLVKRLR